jgi:hypothetical protein
MACERADSRCASSSETRRPRIGYRAIGSTSARPAIVHLPIACRWPITSALSRHLPNRDGQLIAHFEDDSTARGDLLVGADSANSRVARQLLPHAQRVDTGIVAISGRFPLDDAARRETPPAVLRGPTLVMGPARRFMFASAVEYTLEAVTPDPNEYVMRGLSARGEDLA